MFGTCLCFVDLCMFFLWVLFSGVGYSVDWSKADGGVLEIPVWFCLCAFSTALCAAFPLTVTEFSSQLVFFFFCLVLVSERQNKAF